MKKIVLDIEPNTSSRPTVRRCVVCKQHKPEGQFRDRDEAGKFVRHNVCRDCWGDYDELDMIVRRRKER